MNEKHSLDELQAILEEAKVAYKAKWKPKTLKWVARLSERVKFYRIILNNQVLNNIDYVFLGWGALQILFQVCRIGLWFESQLLIIRM